MITLRFTTFVPLTVRRLAAAAVFCALPLASFATPGKNAAALNHLREKAWTSGRVPVIVHFLVTDIDRLTAVSAQFSGGDETPGDRRRPDRRRRGFNRSGRVFFLESPDGTPGHGF